MESNSTSVYDQDDSSVSSENYLDTSYQQLLQMITVIGALGLLALLIYSFTIYKLWNWYIAGLFELPSVPMSFGLGVVLIITVVTQLCTSRISFGQLANENRPIDLIFDRGKRSLWGHITLGLICLTIGYIGNILPTIF